MHAMFPIPVGTSPTGMGWCLVPPQKTFPGVHHYGISSTR